MRANLEQEQERRVNIREKMSTRSSRSESYPGAGKEGKHQSEDEYEK
jgi:hypothetical protein